MSSTCVSYPVKYRGAEMCFTPHPRRYHHLRWPIVDNVTEFVHVCSSFQLLPRGDKSQLQQETVNSQTLSRTCGTA